MAGFEDDPGEMLFSQLEPEKQQEPEDFTLIIDENGNEIKSADPDLKLKIIDLRNSKNKEDFYNWIKQQEKIAKQEEKEEREKRKIEKQQEIANWYINTSKIKYCLRISRATFFNWINKGYLNLGKLKFTKTLTSYSYKNFYEFLEQNSYVYIKGKKEKVRYKPLPSKLPQYLKLEECAEILGLKNRRIFKDMIERTPEKLEGVKILAIGNEKNGYTKIIEKKSFLKYAEKSGGETAK